MQLRPLISILIPLYNAEAYIEETVSKILNQTYSNIEVIIVDDHSTDKSLLLAQKYESEKIHVYVNPQKGGNSARNYAFYRSKGEYVKFMDADDYCSDSILEKQLNCITSRGTINSIVFSTLKFLYPNELLKSDKRYIDKDYIPAIDLLVDMWKYHQFNCPHSHLMHRSLFEKSGGWDESLLRNQDGEFFSRIYAKADMALFVPEEFAVWRRTFKGVSSNNSIKAYHSVIKSYDMIITLLLEYQNTPEMRNICANHVGYLFYEMYPISKENVEECFSLLHKYNLPLQIPIKKEFPIVQKITNWETAIIIHKLCSKIKHLIFRIV